MAVMMVVTMVDYLVDQKDVLMVANLAALMEFDSAVLTDFVMESM